MEVTLYAEKLFSIGTLPVTNTLITTLITTLILATFAIVVSKNVSLIPGKLQSLSEIVIETIFSTIENLSDKKRALRFFPIVATFFLFIFTANYLGLLPGFNTIGMFEHHEGENIFVPIFRSVNSDLNVTLALALISVGVTHFYSITSLGIIDYLKRYFSLNPINLFVGFLEIIAEITKILSLSFRLFGNVFAGETLLVTMSALFAFVLPLPFMFLEMIVGFVQAAIFMMLTLVFMVILTEKHATN
ncbi:MAG: ATP synthase F0 subunit A [Candidatus Woykebacteria bacterium GWB1_45_5]|uniref:ATP synthase subunit a n=2 Tax=Candidatus Woykeibacteriota TaxID=1817899 RepID=A0A1G1W1D5_9BACT|nr:MAG: ATP synthase F0 subunit A [Candidatus Woykebacteria bacterium GWA1_44_8]OGY24713.1 MAG: ATP synthase F0 subunit A [Candidatus Woykebacteria bacterium GWB1_45_5]